MSKIVPVPTIVYDLINKAEGEEVETNVHLRLKLPAPCEVVARGRRPMKCRARLAENRKERSGTTEKGVLVLLRKK